MRFRSQRSEHCHREEHKRSSKPPSIQVICCCCWHGANSAMRGGRLRAWLCELFSQKCWNVSFSSWKCLITRLQQYVNLKNFTGRKPISTYRIRVCRLPAGEAKRVREWRSEEVNNRQGKGGEGNESGLNPHKLKLNSPWLSSDYVTSLMVFTEQTFALLFCL